jgi:hypothetical protein
MKRATILAILLMTASHVCAENLTVNDIQIYDAKSGKLYPTKTTFRDNDVVVAGTNPDFGFINVITYANVISIDAEVSTGAPVTAESPRSVIHTRGSRSSIPIRKVQRFRSSSMLDRIVI